MFFYDEKEYFLSSIPHDYVKEQPPGRRHDGTILEHRADIRKNKIRKQPIRLNYLCTASRFKTETMDPEEPELRQRLNRKNDVNDDRRVPPPIVTPATHPINMIYRISVLCGSLYLLHIMDLFHKIRRSPDVNHLWFKIGLASTVLIAGIKAYMEMYEGKLRKKKIEYKSYKNATHAVLLLFFFASLCFHIALWNAYGGAKTIFVLSVLGYGVLLQASLLMPTWLQNAITFVALTFFIQQYQ
jgi:hypothetical protein